MGIKNKLRLRLKKYYGISKTGVIADNLNFTDNNKHQITKSVKQPMYITTHLLS